MLIDLFCLIGNPPTGGTWVVTTGTPVGSTFNAASGTFETTGNSGNFSFTYTSTGACSSSSIANVNLVPKATTATLPTLNYCANSFNLSYTITALTTFIGSYAYTLTQGASTLATGTFNPTGTTHNLSIPVTFTTTNNVTSSFPIVLTISNQGTTVSTCGSSSTCNFIKNDTVNVTNIVQTSNNISVCSLGNTSVLLNTIFDTTISGATYTTTASSVNATTLTLLGTNGNLTPGSYTVTQNISLSGCTSTRTATITVTAATNSGTNGTITICN